LQVELASKTVIEAGVRFLNSPSRASGSIGHRRRAARFPAIREKHGMKILDDQEHLRALETEGRVLLAITPDTSPSDWTAWAWTEAYDGSATGIGTSAASTAQPRR
jgi:hypothetical protein